MFVITMLLNRCGYKIFHFFLKFIVSYKNMFTMIKFTFIIILLGQRVATQNSRPNIIFILTDDQDVVLGGVTPMTKTVEHFSNNGVIFENSFTHIPICCPSRASILTGQYQHHHQVFNNSLYGNCWGDQWRNSSEKYTFAKFLHDNNYNTFFAGKYMNQYGNGNGSRYEVPPGWSVWRGLKGNSKYYNYTLSIDGKAKDFGISPEDYLPDLIHQWAIDFINANGTGAGRPFFMMLSTPSCHSPFNASEKYVGRFSNSTAPRTPNFEKGGDQNKHWLLRQTPSKLAPDVINTVDDFYGRRWATLLTVDDIIADIVNVLKQQNLFDNTYIVFSSDNGYHLGQFSLPYDKRQMYEFDIRVPLMISGPKVTPQLVRQEVVVNIDLAPTFLDMAGVPIPPNLMDGTSLMPLISNNKLKNTWRSSFLIEYQGERSSKPISYCRQYGNDTTVSNCFPDCICEDAWNNSYSCLRVLEVNGANKIYCAFHDSEKYVEIYDLKEDPYQMNNLAKTYTSFILDLFRWIIDILTK